MRFSEFVLICAFLMATDRVDGQNCGKKVFSKIYSVDENFPVVAKVFKSDDSQFLCNAIIVDSNKVVTSKDCKLLDDLNDIEVKFRIPTQDGDQGFPLAVEKITTEPVADLGKFQLTDVNVLELYGDIPQEYFLFSHCFLDHFKTKNFKLIAKESDENRCKFIPKFHVNKNVNHKIIDMRFLSNSGTETNEGVYYTRIGQDWFLYGLYSPNQKCDKFSGKLFESFERFFKCSEKSATKISGTLSNQIYCPGDVIFHDDFNAKNIDLNMWRFENTLRGGGNWEFQWYSNDPKNTFTDDGNLHFRPSLTNEIVDVNTGIAQIPNSKCTDDRDFGCRREGRYNTINPVRSGSLTTINSLSFVYGVIEIRAKIASGDWLSSVLSLEPKTNSYNWPYSGQIGILEARGNREYTESNTNIGVERASSRIQFSKNWKLIFNTMQNQKGFNEDFHIYKVIWTPENITLSIDGEASSFVDSDIYENFKNYLTGDPDFLTDNPWVSGSKLAPFDKQFYLSLGLKCGGVSFYPDDVNVVNKPYQKPWRNSEPNAAGSFWNARNDWLRTWNDNGKDFEIDYVKITAI